MAQAEFNSSILLFAAFTSTFCLIVAFISVFKGDLEARILGVMIAVAVVWTTSSAVLIDGHYSGAGIIDVVLAVIEISVSVLVALRTSRFWPILVSAIILVLTSVLIFEYLRISVGIFSNDKVELTLRCFASSMILWAMFSSKKPAEVLDKAEHRI